MRHGKFRTIVALLFVGAAPAQTGEPKPPEIPIEQQAEYFRTDGVLAHLKLQLDEANADYEAAVKAVVKTCGEGYAPAVSQDKKHLMCAATPKPVKP